MKLWVPKSLDFMPLSYLKACNKKALRTVSSGFLRQDLQSSYSLARPKM